MKVFVENIWQPYFYRMGWVGMEGREMKSLEITQIPINQGMVVE